MINSKDISKLHPYVSGLCNKLMDLCKKEGIIIQVTSTIRDVEYQRYLYENVPGSTNTPLVGAHGFGLAFDVVPIVNGKAIWDNQVIWNKIGVLGKSLGLTWGGDWKSIIDKPHFEFTQGLSGADLRSGKRPKFPEKKKEFNIMAVKLQPLCKGELLSCVTLDCCEKPSNNAKRNGKLRKGINEPISIYAKTFSEGIDWYLVNSKTEQWVAAHYIKRI